MKVKLMLDTKKFINKPTGQETGGVQKRIVQTEIEIEDLQIFHNIEVKKEHREGGLF